MSIRKRSWLLVSIAALVAVLYSSDARSFATGNQLYEGCAGASTAYCLGYVTAWSDLNVAYEVRLSAGGALGQWQVCVLKELVSLLVPGLLPVSAIS
jgi:hypothetical protein